MPSSKSFAQRAIIAAALSDGESTLSGYTPCDDNRSALSVAKALGAEVVENGNMLRIRGISAAPGCLSVDTLHTGESGFLTRLMIPLLAVLSDRPVTVTGEKTLLRRPLSLAHDIMASFGVRLYSDSKPPRKEDCMLPLTVKGPLYPGRAEVSGQGGSQLISGLLSALPLCGTDSVLIVESPKSLPYLFITADVLKQFGIKVSAMMEGEENFAETMDWDLCSEVRFDIKGGQKYRPASFRIEADWSGAAAFLVAGAIFGELNLKGLDTSTTQADCAILDILSSAGACISQIDDGPTASTGTIHVERSPLSAVSVSLDHCPDLFPQVAVMAAFCSGTSRLSGADRLRHKETDRAAAIIGMLNAFGVPAGLDGGVMVIEGMSLSRRLATGNILKGRRFPSH
jgi:3-phosphoshikimate 1-carboxyvinyltransferase